MIRLTKMTYPDGRELNYNYGSSGSTDDALSRVASLIDDDGSTHLVDYSYLGVATRFVKTDYTQPDVRCDLAHGTGDDPCDGPLDRFGRVTDLLWYDYGSSADLLRFKHGYDRAGNRLYREEAETSDLDQLYAYDDVNRLVQSEEGTLSAGKDSISSLNFAQQWSLDATGNWSAFKEDDNGDATWDLEQTRTSNAVNEITDVDETTGPSWISPAYNRAGNMTTIPQPADPTQSYAATYDAWNRLVRLEDGEDTVAEYVFDGAKRLVVRKKYASGALSQTRHFYHTARWQTIEERLESGGAILSTADRQFTWGRRYIDDLVCRTVNSVHDYAYQDPNWNVILSSSALARVVYQPYGQIRSTSPAASGDLDAWQHYFAGYRRDEDTGLYLVRHRVYQAELGCWVQRDPIGYESGVGNLYEHVASNVLLFTDPLGLAEEVTPPPSGITGPCAINIWAGDTWHSNESLRDFIRNNYDPGDHSICPSRYFGVIGCGKYIREMLSEIIPGQKRPGIPKDQQIPGFPDMPDFLHAKNTLPKMKQGLERAERLAETLCENRRRFCNDGRPRRYECGNKNQRCDSVTIDVQIDDDVQSILRDGRRYDGTPVPGFPNDGSLEMLEILRAFPKTTDCLSEASANTHTE